MTRHHSEQVFYHGQWFAADWEDAFSIHSLVRYCSPNPGDLSTQAMDFGWTSPPPRPRHLSTIPEALSAADSSLLLLHGIFFVCREQQKVRFSPA